MKKHFYIVIAFMCVLLLASCGSSNTAGVAQGGAKSAVGAKTASKISAQAILAQAKEGTFRAGEVIVRYKPGISAASIKSQETPGGKLLSLINGRLVKLPQGVSVADAVRQYMQDPGVEYAEPNYVRHATATVPNDTYFTPQQWALMNTGGFGGGVLNADIAATRAWDISHGSNSVVIAVIDSGVDYDHPDLVNNIWTNPGDDCTNGIDDDGDGYVDDCRGWDFVNKTNTPMDDYGHGTHVAGIAGATGNNSFGVSGVMWSVKLMPLKVLDANGEGTIADEITAIQYAIAKGARIINASFGGSDFSQSELDAIKSANDAGILFIASAGNGGETGTGDNNDLHPEYPASYSMPNIVSVAATDQTDTRASFSNYGPTTVHVAAPGVYILSTVPSGLTSTPFFSLCTGSFVAGYDFCEGTSMAAPHVSGLAGLIYSAYPDFSYSQVRGLILKYVDTFNESPNLATLNGWVYSGGRINAYRSLSSLLAPSNLSGTAVNSHEISLSWTDNATGEDSYIIERRQAGGDFIKVAEAGPDSTAFTDSNLQPSEQYAYRIKAYSALPNPPANAPLSAESGYSAEVSVNTPQAESNSGGGGGGGCSVGGKTTAAAGFADVLVFMMPFFVFAAMKNLRRKR